MKNAKNIEQVKRRNFMQFLSKSVTVEHESSVSHWWESFCANQAEIISCLKANSQGAFDLEQWMSTNLHSVDPNLMWEYAPGIQKPYRLVITPEAHQELRPLVQYIMEKAPSLDPFEFYQYRLPDNLEVAGMLLAQKVGWGDVGSIKFALSRGSFNTVDILFFMPSSLKEDFAQKCAFIAAECLLGEEIMEKWIGAIEIRQVQKGLLSFFNKANTDSSRIPIVNLKKAVAEQIAAIQLSLPSMPYHELVNDEGWCAVESKPERKDDYAFKDDLLTASFFSADIFNALHEGQGFFFPERFSRFGELFLFLKMDGTADDLNKEVFPDRGSIEDALKPALKGNGAVLGGGFGRRYSYIDLAVLDLDGAVETIKHTLQKGKMTKRSWLLFHGPYYQQEWIGIWPDSPTPYLNED